MLTIICAIRSHLDHIGKIIKTNKSISVAWSRIAVDHLALNPHQQLHYNHLDSRQLSWSKQICSSSNGGKARVWLSREVCAAHIDENHLCASDEHEFCVQLVYKYWVQILPTSAPSVISLWSVRRLWDITSKRSTWKCNSQEVEPILRSHNEYTLTRTMFVYINVYVVYSSCVGQMYPRITNLSDSKHALVDV